MKVREGEREEVDHILGGMGWDFFTIDGKHQSTDSSKQTLQYFFYFRCITVELSKYYQNIMQNILNSKKILFNITESSDKQTDDDISKNINKNHQLVKPNL